MVAAKELTPTLGDSLKASIAHLHDKIERLLAPITGPGVTASNLEPPGATVGLRLWLRPSFLAPLLLLGVMVLGFNLAATGAGRVNLSLINDLIQLSLYVVLGLALYMLLRGRTLRAHARERDQRLLAQQADIDRSRNALITSSVAELSADLTALKSQMAGLPPSDGGRIARQGYTRFETMLQKFATAASLGSGAATPTTPVATSLSSLINKALGASVDAATAKHLQLDLPPDAPLSVRSPDLLGAVLTSLVDNAVAFSPNAGHLQITAQGGADHNTITVNDDGPGLPPDKLAALFQPFSRPDGALVLNHEGLGFSLYLDKLIMHYLGGDITAAARSGHGLSVALTLPN